MKFPMIAVIVAIFSVPAFASRGGDITSIGAIRQETRDEPASIRLVRIEGALTCERGAANTGQACDLKLHESKTGRTYSLIEARGAMRLFDDGKKQVLIEGRLADAETLEVRSVQTL